MSVKSWLPPILVAIFIVAIAACEGEQGPTGPAGDTGATGPPGSGSVETYLGGQGKDCMHCHESVVATVKTTGHDNAYDALVTAGSETNPYCLQCHTTGFDSEYASDGSLITQGSDMYGYDDYMGINTPEASSRRTLLEGVQCENCHGTMGPDFNLHQPNVSYASHDDALGNSLSMCKRCHDSQLTEWKTSGHANAAGGDIDAFNAEYFANSGSCQPCHTSEGFIWDNDARYADQDFPDEVSFVGCVTCHDPHVGDAGGGNVAQLRQLGDVEIPYHPGLDPGDPGVPTMSGYGTGQICAQCHHSRRGSTTGGDTSTGAVENQIANGYDHFGPHHSAQMDMFMGIGSYEIPGFDYSGDRAHTHNTSASLSNACADCHMRLSTGGGGQHTIHDFHPSIADNCVPCHAGAPDFNINSFQTLLEAEMDNVAAAMQLGYTTWDEMHTAWDAADPHGSSSIATAVWQREAAYALYFVYDDGSMGVHNPNYSWELVQKALTHAQANSAPSADKKNPVEDEFAKQ